MLHQFKVGDEAIIRNWKEMESEYRVLGDGEEDEVIDTYCQFIVDMKPGCGRRVRVVRLIGSPHSNGQEVQLDALDSTDLALVRLLDDYSWDTAMLHPLKSRYPTNRGTYAPKV